MKLNTTDFIYRFIINNAIFTSLVSTVTVTLTCCYFSFGSNVDCHIRHDIGAVFLYSVVISFFYLPALSVIWFYVKIRRTDNNITENEISALTCFSAVMVVFIPNMIKIYTLTQ